MTHARDDPDARARRLKRDRAAEQGVTAFAQDAELTGQARYDYDPELADAFANGALWATEREPGRGERAAMRRAIELAQALDEDPARAAWQALRDARNRREGRP